MFYTTSQNNSGGSFDFDKEEGVTRFIIVEADNVKEAEAKLESILDSYPQGGDCPCCGDRWWVSFNECDGKEAPSVYGRPVEDYVKGVDQTFHLNWMGAGFEACVHYKDGRKEWF